MLGKKSKYISAIKKARFLKFTLVFAAAAALVFGFFYVRNFQAKTLRERTELVDFWKNGDYKEAFRRSETLLQDSPADYFFLTVYGYSAYQLAFSQISKSEQIFYIDESIFSLRKAILTPEGSSDGRVYYVLGKGYYFKGEEYADLSAQYLEKSREFLWEAEDTDEFLGISYARLKNYEKSIEAFSRSLLRTEAEPPVSLLLAMARSYIELKDDKTAQEYLERCIELSKDSGSLTQARLLLGGIFRERGEAQPAREQFETIIRESGEVAQAHYELGELYYAGGNRALARSEWRKANRLDPAFAPAIERLNL